MAPAAFDLDSFAPPPVVFKLRGIDYRLPGDPDVEIVAQMLRIEEKIRDSEAVEDTAAAVREGKELLLKLALDYDVDQDITDLTLGTTQVLTLFSLILHGGSVAAVVARALTAPDSDLGEDTDGVTTRGDGVGEGDSAPLVSASALSARSSLSDDTGDGHRDTGSV